MWDLSAWRRFWRQASKFWRAAQKNGLRAKVPYPFLSPPGEGVNPFEGLIALLDEKIDSLEKWERVECGYSALVKSFMNESNDAGGWLSASRFSAT